MVNEERIARDVIVVAASAGGVAALRSVLSRLDPHLPASVAVVLHRSPLFETHLVPLLQACTPLRVVEPEGAVPLSHGTVYVAPQDCHMIIDDGCIEVNRDPKEHFTRPAADPLFRSAARAAGQRVVGVVLTGGGSDGTLGCIDIHRAGGLTLVQDVRQAKVNGMPYSALLRDTPAAMLPLDAIAEALNCLARGERFDATPAPSSRP